MSGKLTLLFVFAWIIAILPESASARTVNRSARATGSSRSISSQRSVSRPSASMSRSRPSASVSRSRPSASVSRSRSIPSSGSMPRGNVRAGSRSQTITSRGSRPSTISSRGSVRVSPRVVSSASTLRGHRQGPLTVKSLPGHRSGIHVGANTYRPYYRPSYSPRVVRNYSYPGYRYRPTVRVYHSYPGRYYDPYYYPYYYPYYPNTIRIYGSIPPVVVNHVNVNPVAPVVVQAPTVQVSRQSSLISKAIREGSDDRKQAVRALSEYPDIASVAVLLDVLINDGDDEVRRAAAKSLGEIGDPTAYEALMRSAASEQSERVRDEAVAAADHIKLAVSEQELYLSPKMPPMNTGKEKLGQLLEEIRFGTHDVREDAVKDLDDYPGTQSVCALINVLINDPEEDIREDAAESLGKIGDRMVLPFLDWALYNDPDDEVRKNSKKAIEKIYDTIQ